VATRLQDNVIGLNDGRHDMPLLLRSDLHAFSPRPCISSDPLA